MGIETLCDNEWVSLRRIVLPENGISGYVYSHETRCAGRIISVLPYRNVTYVPEDAYHSAHRTEFLLRDEITPCWSTTEPQLSTITGGWEPQDDLRGRSCAWRELWEEAGYRPRENDLRSLGWCRGTKSTDTVYWLWTVDLSDVSRTGTGDGDGSELEARALCRWVERAELVERCVDPTAHVALARLEARWLGELDGMLARANDIA